MYEPYDRNTASPRDRVAWALCQIIDDDAPMRWTRYRGAAECIAHNPEVMADLQALRDERSNDADSRPRSGSAGVQSCARHDQQEK
jgi:hypothetical protein